MVEVAETTVSFCKVLDELWVECQLGQIVPNEAVVAIVGLTRVRNAMFVQA